MEAEVEADMFITMADTQHPTYLANVKDFNGVVNPHKDMIFKFVLVVQLQLLMEKTGCHLCILVNIFITTLKQLRQQLVIQ